MELEAVYYAAPAPTSNQALTLLGLVFDRLIFPDVYVPSQGIDVPETLKEHARLLALYENDIKSPHATSNVYDLMHLLNLITASVNAQHLKDFCVFTGQPEGTRIGDDVHRIAHELQLAIYGPPPQDFIPMLSSGFSKGLPGDRRLASINSPSWLTYPANALLYAGRTGAIIVNDNPYLPIPAVGGADLKANAKQLSTMMALESVRLALPNIPELTAERLAEFRSETKDSVQPFRQAMLKLSKDLNAAILSDSSLSDVRNAAKFIVETDVSPALEQMKADLARPRRPWYKRPADLAMAAPQIVAGFATMPKGLAIATGLAKAIGILADVRDAQLEKEGIGMRGGFHYLLRIGELKKH